MLIPKNDVTNLMGTNYTLDLRLSIEDSYGTSFNSLFTLHMFTSKPTADQLLLFERRNQPPEFKQKLDTPTPIPCLFSVEAASWAFVLPEIQDPEGYEAFYEFSVEDSDFENLLLLKETDNMVTVRLNTEQVWPDASKTVFEATIRLFDEFDAKQSYTLQFSTLCKDLSLNGEDYYVETLLGVWDPSLAPPKVKGRATASGQLVLTFSEEMRVPANFETFISTEFFVKKSGRKLE